MKKIVSYLAVGVIGYFIGFYEYKYKLYKTVSDEYFNKKTNEESN